MANLKLRFNPKSLDDTQPMLEFVVFANSTSQEVEYKDPLRLVTAVVKRAELSITGLVSFTYNSGVKF